MGFGGAPSNISSNLCPASSPNSLNNESCIEPLLFTRSRFDVAAVMSSTGGEGARGVGEGSGGS